MYVIVINNRVELGPMAWKKTFFQNFLKEELELDVLLPAQYSEPIITSEYKILPSRLVYDIIDDKLFQHHGPFWEITDTEAIGTFQQVPKSIESVKNNLNNWITDYRWKKETGGIKYTLGDLEVTIPTSREARGQFQVSGSIDILWKFQEGWVTLTSSDFSLITSKIAEHVQQCFEEEHTLHQEVLATTTLEELKAIQERLKVDVIC